MSLQWIDSEYLRDRVSKLEAENERVSQGWVDAERRLLEAEERLTTLRREATAALLWCETCGGDDLNEEGYPPLPPLCSSPGCY